MMEIPGFTVVRVPYLEPKLERERSRDGSCLNLSAMERNARKLERASKVYVDHSNQRIYAPAHIIDRLREKLELEKQRGLRPLPLFLPPASIFGGQ